MKLIKVFPAVLSALICATPILFAQDTKPEIQLSVKTEDIDVDGHKLRLQVAGSGTPAVVLDYGFGGSINNWNNVFPAVARFTRFVAYDRAGYGKSEPGPEPRSQTQIATELHTLLQRAKIAPP